MTKPKTKKRTADRAPGQAPARDRTLHVRLTETEEENVQAAAWAAGTTTSIYVRACLHYVMSRGLTP